MYTLSPAIVPHISFQEGDLEVIAHWNSTGSHLMAFQFELEDSSSTPSEEFYSQIVEKRTGGLSYTEEGRANGRHHLCMSRKG